MEGLTDVAVLEKIKWLKDESESVMKMLSELDDSEQASIARGIEDSRQGRSTPHNEVKNSHKEWL